MSAILGDMHFSFHAWLLRASILNISTGLIQIASTP